MHEYHEFPKWKYHAEKEAVIVESSDAEAALGAGWADSPAELDSDSGDSNDALAKIDAILHPKKPARRAKA